MNSELSMDQLLIEKLTNILEVNLDREHFGVKELAKEAGLSRSQLLRKLKSIKGISASKFIREYRLQKAMVMLQNNAATASEIAYSVGFSSPTYFNTCFHDHYGYPPGEVKFRNPKVLKEHNVSENHELVDEPPATGEVPSVKKQLFRKRMVWVNTFFIILLSVISYNLYQNYKDIPAEVISYTDEQDKSIAILPFKNLSGDIENQYFIDGISGSIQNNLNKISGLKVIASSSMEKYRNSTLTALEIAKEVDVIYLLEGSVQKHGDSIRVITNLVNARNNTQLQSFVFDWEYKHIFDIQTKIALDIAKQLDLAIAPEKLETLKTKPTDNLEAYKLYLKGRFYWHQRTDKDLKKSIYYFNQAIELDSMYPLAYAGLADAYYVMSNWGLYPKNDGFAKAKEFAQKSLSINNNTAEAHATLAGLFYEERRWKDAEKELKLAISLNPNNATSHQYYYLILEEAFGKSNKAREEINMAIKLNPFNCAIRNLSAGGYFRNSNFLEAIEESKIGLDLANEPAVIFHLRLKIILSYLNLNKNIEALENIKLVISTDPSIENYEFLDEIYQKSGINGVLHWLIDWILKNKQGAYNRNIAKVYAIIGDSQNTLKYLEKGFEINELGFPAIRGYPNFDFIKTEPRYLAILEKMNLGDYE